MSSKIYTSKYWFIVLLCILVPVSSFAAPDLSALVATRGEFSQALHAASQTTERRSVLEQNLARFEAKVQDAKKVLEDAKHHRELVTLSIDRQKSLVTILQGQLHAAQDSRGFYQTVAERQQDDIRSFVRYVASRELVSAETGPVYGGVVLRLLSSRTLGETIDDQIQTSAILQARMEFVGRLSAILAELKRTEQRLVSMTADYTNTLSDLERQVSDDKKTELKKAAFIDLSWKEKKLNEAELKSVIIESTEANARMEELQQNLVAINTQLKERTLDGLRDELQKIQKQEKILDDQRTALQRKDEAMRLIEQIPLKTHQDALKVRNTDTKLYRRIEERSLELARIQAILVAGFVADNPRDPDVHRPLTDKEKSTFEQSVITITDQIKLMKDGIPEEEALAYVTALQRASAATIARAEIAKDIETLKPARAELLAKTSKKAAEIDLAEQQFTLADLPPLFVWPVKGPVTAGYLDPDYVKVFSIPHRAIDIAATQGSIVHSIADGVVFAVHDGGATGFSYVLIGHRHGYASLYGHVSKFLVKKGDVVSMGQGIALSGGTPGTHGAGHMTTGAHVHLEVTKDGVHVDPRSVLR